MLTATLTATPTASMFNLLSHWTILTTLSSTHHMASRSRRVMDGCSTTTSSLIPLPRTLPTSLTTNLFSRHHTRPPLPTRISRRSSLALPNRLTTRRLRLLCTVRGVAGICTLHRYTVVLHLCCPLSSLLSSRTSVLVFSRSAVDMLPAFSPCVSRVTPQRLRRRWICSTA